MIRRPQRPRQHAWRTPAAGQQEAGPPPGQQEAGQQAWPPPGQQAWPPPGQQAWPPPGQSPPAQPGRQRFGWGGANHRRTAPRRRSSVVWLVVIAAVVAVLVRSNRISSTDVIIFCTLIPSVILHEVSHGAVALAFGDDTAKRAGRLTLDPIRHVDLFGTIIVPAITTLAGLGYFGWAKPVPVDVRRLRSPRNHGVLVALAGPLTNVLLAAVLGAVFYFVFVAGRGGPVPTSIGARIIFDAGVINLWVACFNMVPIPPLDGSALLERLLPASWWPGYLRIRPYGMVLVLGAILIMSYARTYPLDDVFGHIATWWGHMIHAY